ncbi:MAG: twin-arginine translocase TatA/TatE family subunit [Planctomycetaceae bacterium]
MFGSVGVWQLALFAFVLLMLFGSRLPSVMRSLGEGVREFKSSVRETPTPLESESEPA